MGASAATTGSAGGLRAQAIEGEENLEVGEANPSQKGGATNDTVEVVEEMNRRGYQEAPGTDSAAADHYQIPGKSEQEVRRKQTRRAAKMVRG